MKQNMRRLVRSRGTITVIHEDYRFNSFQRIHLVMYVPEEMQCLLGLWASFRSDLAI